MAYIPALIIQKNTYVFVDTLTDTVGQTQLIPTPNSGGAVDGDFWATPVTGFGIQGTGFKYTPTSPESTNKPDAQSFHVIRVIFSTGNQNADDWYALGTSIDYTEASAEAECCGTTSPPIIMPTASDLPIIAACQILCNTNDAGAYIGVFAVPTPDTGTYAANGYYNDVALPQVTGATVAALVTALNLNGSWNAIGTWTNPDTMTLIVTQADGSGTDVLCTKFSVS